MTIRRMGSILVAWVFLGCGALVWGGCSGAKQREIAVSVTERGFEPAEIKVRKGQEVTLIVTRKTDLTCATEIVVQKELPLNQPVRFALGPIQEEVSFACAMDMYKGTVKVK